MLERTFSFWRRLVTPPGGPTDPAATGTAHADRRLWVRYEANAHTTLQPTQPTASERLSARVRDISVGGANLVVERRFPTGQMLSLELPVHGGTETQIVLACVVRVVPDSGGAWSLGCVFSRELAKEDIEGFGDEKQVPPSIDQRTWVRYPVNIQTRFQKIGDPDEKQHPAQVLNISASGIGLLLTEPAEAGALFNLELIGKEGQLIRTILACVVHSTVRANGDIVVGCNFIRELTEVELKSLL
jgi:c-di-GMP-binding flagellar brake protein YcgR